MKTDLLAGGFGTRLAEESESKPKPMVEVGGRPILWHIMRIYAERGFKEFVVALGYRGDLIKRFFLDYYYFRNNLSIDLRSNQISVQGTDCEDWLVHLRDTGLHTQTGGRIRMAARRPGDQPGIPVDGHLGGPWVRPRVRHHRGRTGQPQHPHRGRRRRIWRVLLLRPESLRSHPGGDGGGTGTRSTLSYPGRIDDEVFRGAPLQLAEEMRRSSGLARLIVLIPDQ